MTAFREFGKPLNKWFYQRFIGNVLVAGPFLMIPFRDKGISVAFLPKYQKWLQIITFSPSRS